MKVLRNIKKGISGNKIPPRPELLERIRQKKIVEEGLKSEFWLEFLNPNLASLRHKASQDLKTLSASNDSELMTKAQGVEEVMSKLDEKVDETIQQGQIAEEQLSLLDEQEKASKEEE